MGALFRLASFELRYQLRRVSAWVYFAMFAALAFMLTAAAGGAWPELDLGDRALIANSPSSIFTTLTALALLGVPVTAAISGNAVYRDFQTGTHPLFFTTPIAKTAYLGGRWLGAAAANVVVFLGIPLGILLATVSGLPEPERLAPFSAAAYLEPLGVIVVPNVLFTSAVFLTLAALTRRMLPNYVGGLVLLVGWATAQGFVAVLDQDWAVWVLDPFGSAAVDRATRYWTVAERNTAGLPIGQLLLLNRALWLAVGAAVFAAGAAAFRFTHYGSEGRRVALPYDAAPPPALPRPATVRRDFTLRAHLRLLVAETRRAVREVVANVYFPIIVVVCMLFVLLSGSEVESIYGTATFPVTYKVLERLEGGYALLLLIVITFYAGELVWNERELRASQIHDSLPVPTWVPLAAKLLALAGIAAALQASQMVVGMMMQAADGWYRFQPGLYLRELFVHQYLGAWLPLAVLAVLVQTVVNHKYLGHFLLILYYLGSAFLFFAGIEHNLLVFPSAPELVWSDMNGWGHAPRAWGWFTLYWSGVAVLMVIVCALLWVRGEEPRAGRRLKLARPRLTRPLLRVAAATGALVLATGGFIFYNTNVLNDFSTRRESERVQAEYEKRHKRFETAPQPRIVAARLNVDIEPDTRDLRLRGAYHIVNRTRARIDTVHVDVLSSLEIRDLSFDRPAARVIANKEGGYYAFRLSRPLMPGDSAELRFDLEHDERGFANEPAYGPVVGNGTFFHSDYLPSVGYNASGELMGEGARRKHGLPQRPRIAPIDDPRGRMRNFVAYDADWIDFDATVSTSADQVAVAPGYLVREWKEGGRRYFRYRSDGPMLNFYAFLSGRYTVRKDRWNNVALEIYHHPTHTWNVGRMMRSMKASLGYYTRVFGPYQHRQLRIFEFPRYGQFAQSFDNTIPYSEAIGFIADVEDDDIDYPFFVTAHEVAHQWWGHQLAGADVQGAAMLSETLAEYSALMVMEKEFGREKIGRFLRYELDGYLRGRGGDLRGETPLMLAENQQYLHYNKGALAMYALRDYLGEAAVNGALRAFLAENRFRGPPYPTSLDLMRHLEAAAPDSLRPFVAHLFREVTIFQNRAVSAEARPLGGNRYEVTLTVEAKLLRADPRGNEEEVRPLGVPIDIGVLGTDDDRPLYLRKHRVRPGRQTIRVTVEGRPVRAGIDPRHVLIDRDIDDNVVRVSIGSDEPAATEKADTAKAAPRGEAGGAR